MRRSSTWLVKTGVLHQDCGQNQWRKEGHVCFFAHTGKNSQNIETRNRDAETDCSGFARKCGAWIENFDVRHHGELQKEAGGAGSRQAGR